MIARGVMLGPDQPVILHMLDIEPAKQVSAGSAAGQGGGGGSGDGSCQQRGCRMLSA